MAARNGNVSRPAYTQWLNKSDATNTHGYYANLPSTAGATDSIETKPDEAVDLNVRDAVTEVASSTYLPSVYYSTDSFTQEVSLYEVSDLLPSTDRKDQACSSNHVDLCVANRRFSPDIVKSVVKFCKPQALLCEFQICQEIFIQVPAAVCYIDSVHIQYNSAVIEVVCTMKCQQSSDAKRVSTAGFRTGIETGGPQSVTTFATRLMCDARERNMPWDPGIRVC